MSRNVHLQIGGRAFTVACAPGEEAHIRELGQVLDATVTAGGLRSMSEPRMLLFTALMLADDLHEARAALALARQEPSPETETRASRIADRLEALALELEQRAASA